jgi:NAD(P)-dependent dehydrogenase (short-subunit alcohol dehydrogenase family)
MSPDASKVVLVSGAARGIGEATVRLFAQHGYAVVASDVLPQDAWDLEPGVASIRETLDVRDEAAVVALVQRTMRELGRIDVLANIAGVVLVKPLEETTWEDYRVVVDVNLGGTFLACKHVLPVMKAQRSGSIVNMASVSGHVGQTDHAVYGSTKAAVIGLCRALAWEVAPWNIRVNSLSPGSVDTPMLRGDIEIEAARLGLPLSEVRASREAEQALGRWADPAEIAEAVYFLASSKASFVTGTDLLVDAGWVAR